MRNRILAAPAILLMPGIALASEDGAGGHGGILPLVLFFLAVMLLFARIGAMAERFGQPAVLGELVLGVALGALAFLPGLGVIETLKHEEFIKGVAEIGVILLLFRTGLESNIAEMRRVGAKALVVACVGVILPFIGGYVASRMLMPGISFESALFIGATLTATSVGITARVFKDLGFLKSTEAKIVLGAAVIDDILGLLILAVVGGIVSSGELSMATVGALSLKAFLFLAGSLVVGQLLAPRFGTLLSGIHGGVGMKMALALLFCFAYAYGASALAGLAPIVGAFAAGLVLDPVHFRGFMPPEIARRLRAWAEKHPDAETCREMIEHAEKEEHSHVETLIDDVSRFFVPIFFVYTGLQVNLAAFADHSTLGIALAVTAVAFAGKILCGYAAGAGVDKKLIGFGMVPRGEVGLIFANVGKELGVVDDRIFAMAVIMVILTTLLTPPILSGLIKRKAAAA